MIGRLLGSRGNPGDKDMKSRPDKTGECPSLSDLLFPRLLLRLATCRPQIHPIEYSRSLNIDLVYFGLYSAKP